eukprot:2525195-Rhodomonas_salina.1
MAARERECQHRAQAVLGAGVGTKRVQAWDCEASDPALSETKAARAAQSQSGLAALGHIVAEIGHVDSGRHGVRASSMDRT